jgi:hypothetical protein
MKRPAFIAATLLAVGLLFAPSGATAGGPDLSWELRGSAEWAGSGFLAQSFTIHGAIMGVGTYRGTLSAGAYFTTETCGPQCAPITGTVEFVTNKGRFTTDVGEAGLVSVISIGSGTTYSFTLPLTIVSGTRAYGNAGGALDLVYSSTQPTNQPDCVVCPIVDGGTLTGTITHPAPALAPAVPEISDPVL